MLLSNSSSVSAKVQGSTPPPHMVIGANTQILTNCCDRYIVVVANFQILKICFDRYMEFEVKYCN